MLQPLLNLLQHTDRDIRSSATIALANSKDSRVVAPLGERLADPDRYVRETTVICLGRLADASAINALGHVLNDVGGDPNVSRDLRRFAATALGGIRDEAALPALYTAMDHTPEDDIQAECVNALARLGEVRQAVYRLFELLAHPKNAVRHAASTQLGRIGAHIEDLDLRDYIVSNLVARLSDTGRANVHFAPDIAHAAAKSLYYLGTPEAIQALEQWEQNQKVNQNRTQQYGPSRSKQDNA